MVIDILNKSNDEKGFIFNIQKFSTEDGPGIRTLVFMKGCPLRCLWCFNPESQNHRGEIVFVKENCIQCRACTSVCPVEAIDLETLEINRELCNNCGKCSEICPTGAKKLIGESVTVEELIEKVEKDRIFYRNSDGGVTVSGGEPLIQYKFVSKFLKKCQDLNINTAIETCGYGKWGHLEAIVRYTDLVFMDIKHMDPEVHKNLTGKSNERILENAKLTSRIAPMIIRIPVIPGYNDSRKNIADTVNFVKGLRKVDKIELLPYHSLGDHKYKLLGRRYELDGLSFPTENNMEQLKEMITNYGCRVEIKSSGL